MLRARLLLAFLVLLGARATGAQAQSLCLPDDLHAQTILLQLKLHVSSTLPGNAARRDSLHLAPVDTSSSEVVSDPAVCNSAIHGYDLYIQRMKPSYVAPKHPTRRAYVVRVGYLWAVLDPDRSMMAGEWQRLVILSHRFKGIYDFGH